MLKPVFIRQKGVLIRILPDDIICLVTDKNETRLYLANNTYFMVRVSLTNALKKLPPDMFIRVTRSLAFSVFYIEKVYKGYLKVGEETVPFPRYDYKAFLKKLNIIG